MLLIHSYVITCRCLSCLGVWRLCCCHSRPLPCMTWRASKRYVAAAHVSVCQCVPVSMFSCINFYGPMFLCYALGMFSPDCVVQAVTLCSVYARGYEHATTTCCLFRGRILSAYFSTTAVVLVRRSGSCLTYG